jgi:hypothetical protein
MTEPNSGANAVERLVRPEELMDELGIKKDAYYAYLKHLNFKAAKDDDGKAFLTPDQVADVQALRAHVLETGKIEGFVVGNGGDVWEDGEGDRGQLVRSVAGDLAGELTGGMDLEAIGQGLDELPEDQVRSLVGEAAELAASRLVAPALLRRAIADQMTLEDLPGELRQRVAQVQDAAVVSFDAQGVAGKVLGQWRRMQSR